MLALVGGCLSSPPQPTPEPTQSTSQTGAFGLGIALGALLPPADFQEGRDALADLRTRVRPALPAILDDCRASTAKSEILGLADASESPFAALNRAYEWCSSVEVADRPYPTSNHETLYSSERNLTVGILEQTSNALGTMPVPSTVTDAEVMGWIERRFTWARDSVHTADFVMENYRSTKDPGAFENAILNLWMSRAENNVTILLTRHLKWTTGPCGFDLQQIKTDATQSLEKVTRLAKQRARPGDEESLSTFYGRIVLDEAPATAFFDDQGWIPGLLWMKGLSDWGVAIAESDERLPTNEEAEFLLYSYRNATRTLYTEDIVEALAANLEYYAQSAEDAQRPELGLSYKELHALSWPFLQYC